MNIKQKREYADYVADISAGLTNGQSLHFDCKYCTGKACLCITKENGRLKWFCFKCNSEETKGIAGYNAGLIELKSQLKARTAVKEAFTMPNYLIRGLGSPMASDMLDRYNCSEPYKKGLFEVAFDPQMNRVCFLVKEKGNVVGLIGRAVDKNTKPKTLNYPNSDLTIPFICGTMPSIILVEDCLSAASVTRISHFSGLALLGTSLKDDYLPLLRKYDTIIVALDRDARKKAKKIFDKLTLLCYKNVLIWNLTKDIKDQTDEELSTNWRLYE